MTSDPAAEPPGGDMAGPGGVPQPPSGAVDDPPTVAEASPAVAEAPPTVVEAPPTVPLKPAAPAAPTVTDTPAMPVAPAAAGMPTVPGMPTVTGTPAAPSAQAAHPVPGVPQVPGAPGTPGVPGLPGVPAGPMAPAAGHGGYGGPSYGPPSYGQSPYGAPRYGQPGYPPPGYAQPGYAQPGMLASAADRERTIDVLKAAYGEGRLTRDEFDIRCARVMAARRYGDLAAIVADLPAGPHAPVVAYPPGYYQPVPVTPTSGLAIGSLVCGILEFFTLGLSAIPAVILGHLARGQIRRTGERGDGMAIAGLILGWLAIGGWALFILLLASRP